ncbi:unnamed protein product [Heterobilharzia americana]|nr:unnamed protein product [Heterobilharzia americana]
MMDEVDPYFSMQNEVLKNLKLTETLYDDWKCGSGSADPKILTRLRQTIKNIEWDLMDLQETVGAVENNPTKFRLSDKDISARRQFLSEAKNVIKNVKNHLSTSDFEGEKKDSTIDFTVHIAPPPVLSSSLSNGDVKMKEEIMNKTSPSMIFNSHSKVSNIYSSSNDPLTEQKKLLYEQDNRLNQLGTTISNLKVLLLDDFTSEMVSTESRLDSVTKRTAHLLHLSTDRRQWCAIFSLLITLIIILILFGIL